MDPAARIKAWHIQFALLALIWGSSFLLIKVAVRDLTPMQVSFGRIAIGALALLALMAVRREPLPRGRRTWAHLAVVGLLMNAIPFTLFGVGEERLTSVVAGLWNATTPLFAVIVASLMLSAGVGGRRAVLGILVGFAGVVVLLAPWQDLDVGDLRAHGALALAAACYGIGTPYMRRFLTVTGERALGMAAVQLSLASLMLAMLLPFYGGIPTEVGALAGWSVVALGVVGSGIAYVLFYAVIRVAGATVASTVTYVMPIVSTALGVLVLREPLTWNLLAGGAIVLLGVWLNARAARRSATRHPAAVDPDEVRRRRAR